MRVTVLGAGVVGLASARRLAAAGLRVRVVADRSGADATSGAAGAIWLPYQAEPADRVAAWGAEAYRWLAGLARDEPRAGVEGPVPLWVAAATPAPPRWAGAVPDEGGLAWVARDALPAEVERFARRAARPVVGAWRFLAPVIDPAAHLAWLADGLEIDLRPDDPVASLDELDGDLVVHCAGPRAGRLTADPELTPNLGQVIEVPRARWPADLGWADERDPAAPVYGFPRGRRAVLGGCAVPGAAVAGAGEVAPWERPDRPRPRSGPTGEIAARWRAAGLEVEAHEDPAGAVRVKAGWRPVRSTVRVERRGRVVHNYGHGGAGYTLAWGCAGEVVALAREAR